MGTDEKSLPALDRRDALRAVTYRLLSEIFARELSAERIGELARAASEDSSPFVTDPALVPLFEKLKLLKKASKKDERDLAGAFAFLFLGVGGGRSAPPYESVFVAEHARTNQEPAAYMMRELALLDRHITRDLPEPADHVAVELATAAEMIEAGVAPARQHAFLRDRLDVWLSDFASACDRGDRSGFYAIAATAAANFVAADLTRLAAVPSNPIKEVETCNV